MKEGKSLKSIWITFLIFWFGLPNFSFLSSTYSIFIENDLVQRSLLLKIKLLMPNGEVKWRWKYDPSPTMHHSSLFPFYYLANRRNETSKCSKMNETNRRNGGEDRWALWGGVNFIQFIQSHTIPSPFPFYYLSKKKDVFLFPFSLSFLL